MPKNDNDQVLITKEGLLKLKEELSYLKNVRRKEVAKRIKEAISYGDLSENSEYEDAKNEQAFIEGKIVDLDVKIKNATIIKEVKQSQSDSVTIGSTVTIYNKQTRKNEEYIIVGSTETDPLGGKISNESPVGSSLLGRRVGDMIKVEVPEGHVSYEIKAIA